MRRAKSNSHSNTVLPSRADSNYVPEHYDGNFAAWAFNRSDSSPPPPYSSREGSHQSGPTAPSAALLEPSLRSHRRADYQPPVSSEYTPLLEDFTRKFMESQLSVPNGQQVHVSTSQLVPPELLVLGQQQAPYNPNFDSLSTTSSNTSFPMSEYSRRNSVNQPRSEWCFIFPRSRWLHTRWFVSNFILLVSLMSFNFGMLISPQIYVNFFLVFLDRGNSTSKDHLSNAMVIDLIISSLVQVVLMLIATISGLILLYSACKVVSTLRKRFQLSVKYRVHMSNQTPFPWFFITYERIVYETLGPFFARLLSLILAVYLFGFSAIYVLILSDYLDMLLALVSYEHISKLFCGEHTWFFSHDFVVSIWLSLVVLLVFGINSFRARNQHSSSLTYLKKITVFVGFFSVVFLVFMVVFIFVSSNQSSQANLLKVKRMYSSNYRTLVCLNSDSDFDWACLNKNWILLLSSVPLLIMPFHLNELLISLLFASRQKQPHLHKGHTSRNVASNEQTRADLLVIGPSTATEVVDSMEPRFTDIYPAIGPSPDLHQRLLQEASQWEQLDHTMLDDTIGGNMVNPLLGEPSSSHIFSLSGLFCKPLLSFGSVRNLYVFVTFSVCLLNIIVNVFVYISAFNETSDSEDSRLHITREQSSPSRYLPDQSRFSQSEEILLLDFNFLRHYLHIFEPPSGAQDKQSWQRYLLIAASVLLLLKTTLTYLLLTFRGLLAHQTLTSSTKPDKLGKKQVGFCLNSFLFTSPFLVWNFLVLLFALFVEHYPNLLQYLLLLIGWLNCFLVFVFPALVLLYFSIQSMRKNSLALPTSYALLAVAFKPLRWPKWSLLLGLSLLCLGLFFLVFWLYAYFQTSHTTLMSILPMIAHNNSTFLYCPN